MNVKLVISGDPDDSCELRTERLEDKLHMCVGFAEVACENEPVVQVQRNLRADRSTRKASSIPVCPFDVGGGHRIAVRFIE
jgi:hypothetical protein